MNEDVVNTLDLARLHLEVGDLELATQNLLACLFAVAAMTGETPESLLRKMIPMISSSEEWAEAVLPSIVPDWS